MSRRLIIGLTMLFAMASDGRGDVVPPNMKRANAMGRFENLGDFPDYVFFAAHHPDNRFLPEEQKKQFRGSKIDLAQPEIGLSNHYTVGQQFLLAVPKTLLEDSDVKPTNDWFDGKTPGVLQAELTGGVQFVPETDPRPAFWTVFKVTIATDAATNKPALAAQIVSEDQPAPWSVRWLIAGGVGAVALAMIGFYLFRMRKSPAQSQ
jgi:hypothetical protein